MASVVRRRAVSPRGLSHVPLHTQQHRGRFTALARLVLLLGVMLGLVYFASGFKDAVQAASDKVAALRASTVAMTGAKVNGGVGRVVAHLAGEEDVVELVRPKSEDVTHVQDADQDTFKADEEGEARKEAVAEEEDEEDSKTGLTDVVAVLEQQKHVDEAVDQFNKAVDESEAAEVLRDGAIDKPEAGAEQVEVKNSKVIHEEDDTPTIPEDQSVEEDVSTPETEVEEDLDAEEHAVDEDAQDVVVEGEQDDEDEEEESKSATSASGPKPLPRFTREELEERGFGHVLYAYRVVAPFVAVRTKPSPIGGLLGTTKDKVGLTKDSKKLGEVVVGYKLAKVYGLWLKLGPYTWMPVTKKETAEGPFHSVMKQIRKISLPGNLRKYWRTRIVDCDTVYAKRAEARAACHDKNMIRNGVLNVMRKMKLMDTTMDPDIHPFPSIATPRRQAHATSMTDFIEAASENTTPLIKELEQLTQDLGQAVADSINLAPESIAPPPASTSTASSESKTVSSSSSSSVLQADLPLDAALAKQEAEEKQQTAEEGGEDEDTVDTDIECRKFKFWHLCARHAKCAWRRLPNEEYCDLDTDPPLDQNTIPVELRQETKYDFFPSTKLHPKPKYFIYQPSGGWNNQRLLLESALIICKLLNRTCIVPPAAPHSNYFYNYNNIPASAIVGMPRVLNFEALNQVVSAVAIPQGQTFKNFMDQEVLRDSTKYSVKTVVRDPTKYKPGAMKKWSERDIIRLYGSDSADIIFFANQTLWATTEWKGSLYGWNQRKLVQSAVMYPNHMKKVARQIAENLGPYHAVHVRRGDKVFESSFSRLYHGPEWYAERIAMFREQSPKVYIATDEPNRAYFDTFKDHQLSIVFWESLPGYDEIVRPYLQHFPKRMFFDVLGMIEQLICSYAVMFLGSGYSTFTTYILRLRKYREIIASDTSFSDRSLGLPESVRNLKSTCDPLKALGHSKPC